MQHKIYLGAMAVGYLPRRELESIVGSVGERLKCQLHDSATHHWIPTGANGSPLLMALKRYDDGSEGSFVVDTSSETEIALFKAEFEVELEILRDCYSSVEVIFGVCSSR